MIIQIDKDILEELEKVAEASQELMKHRTDNEYGIPLNSDSRHAMQVLSVRLQHLQEAKHTARKKYGD